MNKASESANGGLGIGGGVWEEVGNGCRGTFSFVLVHGVEVCMRENGVGA